MKHWPPERAEMRFAYADPPYLGQARHYRHHPNAHEWDDEHTHWLLIQRLVREYPDGWALSCSSPSLRVLLPMCPDDVRIGAWVKPFHIFKRGVRPAYAWEPVIYRGGRNTGHRPPGKGEPATTPRDFIAANITLQRGLVGAKPEKFCRWILDLLGYRDGDIIDDLFPGTGVLAKVAAQGVIAWSDDCCDMHNIHCEPPADLCCNACTEITHPMHDDPQSCVLVQHRGWAT